MKKHKSYSGRDLSDGFKRFCRNERSWMKKTLTKLGCTDFILSCQFNYYYGFFTAKTGQVFYFSIDDVRYLPSSNLEIRQAKDYNDFKGMNREIINRTPDGLQTFLMKHLENQK